MALLSLYFQNCASDFDDFCTDVRDSCPEWFGLSVVCSKILVCPPGGVPQIAPFSFIIGSPDVFRLRKEPINSLSYVRAYVRACVRQFRSYSLDRSIFGLSALAEGPMDSRSFVRPCVRPCVRDAISGDPRIRFFWNFALSCIKTKKMFQADFWKKISFAPQGGFWPKKTPFWLKNGLLSLYLRNRASDFDDFFTDVRYYCS